MLTKEKSEAPGIDTQRKVKRQLSQFMSKSIALGKKYK